MYQFTGYYNNLDNIQAKSDYPFTKILSWPNTNRRVNGEYAVA